MEILAKIRIWITSLTAVCLHFSPQIKTSAKSGATAINYVVTLSEVTSALVMKVMCVEMILASQIRPLRKWSYTWLTTTRSWPWTKPERSTDR